MSSVRDRLGRAFRVLVPFLSLQVLTTVSAAIAGIVVVRRLPVPDFAVYTIAISVQSSLAVLSDIGVTTLLVSRVGTFHADLNRIAALARTARLFRLRLLGFMLAFGIPLLWWSLGNSRPPLVLWLGTLLIAMGTVALQVSASIDGTLLLAMLRAERQQLGQLLNSLVRLGGFLGVLGAFPHFLVALAFGLLGAGSQAALNRWDINRVLPTASVVSEDDRLAFRAFARSQFVNAAYYAFSSQITIWIVGFVSPAQVVANLGALGRLTNVVVLAQSALVSLVVPRMARYSAPRLLLRRYAQVLGVAIAACATVLVLSFLEPGLLLWVIGPKYASLRSLLPLAMASAVTYTISATIFGLNSAKAWFHRAWVAVPMTIALQVLCLLVFDVSRLQDALLFGWATVFPPLVVNSVIAWTNFRRLLAT